MTQYHSACKCIMQYIMKQPDGTDTKVLQSPPPAIMSS